MELQMTGVVDPQEIQELLEDGLSTLCLTATIQCCMHSVDCILMCQDSLLPYGVSCLYRWPTACFSNPAS